MILSDRFRNDGRPGLDLSEDKLKLLSDFAEARQADLADQDCCFCGARDFEVIAEKERYGLAIPTGLCRNCGYIQSTKYYSPEAINDFYSGLYRKVYGIPEPEGFFRKQNKRRAPAIFDFVEPLIKPGGRTLEIGCGTGGNLKYFADRGYSVTGIDMDDRHLAYGCALGLDLRLSSIGDFNPDEKFDLIILCHVLEHFPDPKVQLRRIRSLLAPDGLLYVEVPSIHNVKSINKGNLLQYLHIAHYSAYSSKTLEHQMRACGFQPVKADRFIRSLWKPAAEDDAFENVFEENKAELLQLEKEYLEGEEAKPETEAGAPSGLFTIFRNFRLPGRRG